MFFILMALFNNLHTQLAGTPLSPAQQTQVTAWEKLNGGTLPRCFLDGEFLAQFQHHVPATEQIKYVQNTSLYLANQKTACDPNYVLCFRRSIPGDVLKPEVFWTDNFWVAFNGLSRELPHHSVRRIYSEIMVATKKVLDAHQPTSAELNQITEKYDAASSDGEIRIAPKPFDLANCLFIYQPAAEQKEREAYQQTPDALTKAQVLEKIAAFHHAAEKQL